MILHQKKYKKNKMTNKQLTQQNLDELMRQTLLNILSAKRIIYTYYKNKQLTKREKNGTVQYMATDSTIKR
jgi:hypothetical protein